MKRMIFNAVLALSASAVLAFAAPGGSWVVNGVPVDAHDGIISDLREYTNASSARITSVDSGVLAVSNRTDTLAVSPFYVTTRTAGELGNEQIASLRDFKAVNNQFRLHERYEQADVDATWRLSILENSGMYNLLYGYSDEFNDTNGIAFADCWNAKYNTNGYYHNMVTTGGDGDPYALEFDGIDDHFTNAYSTLIYDCTIAFWMKLKDSSRRMQAPIGIKGVNGSDDLLWCGYDWYSGGGSERIGFATHYDGGNYYYQDYMINPGTNWTFVVCTRTNEVLWVWVNNVTNGNAAPVFAGDVSETGFGEGGIMTIGMFTPWGGGYFEGTIDALGFWNRCLSDAEINTLWNGGDGLYVDTAVAPYDSGLLFGYNFEEGTGTDMADETGNYNGEADGTVPTWVTGERAIEGGAASTYYTNMVLASSNSALPFIPSNIAFYAKIQNMSTTNAQTNVDLIAFCSANNKTNWEQVLFASDVLMQDGDRMFSGIGNVSHGVSSNIFWKLDVTNKRPIRVKSWAVIGGE